ncbi:uncharacterized protein N7443_000348 [Penicillium atrosanguineum]|uniref:uncharacterized protein n=1 Tax=Penicillium atrosanguineum TaxID=1132637 RepID=UPI00239F8955|nr:uncharacterized protein N7443_000348 [Penicillium atrosanguineum]KAJ5313464.1 hypothetical protein N7443_000348 [Penicillium atrosanguineum]
MRLSFYSVSACTLASAVIASASSSIFNVANFESNDIIYRDVAVIGGGSAGTYSAISLKDKGKSVIVVEKKGRLGGHAETYLDPVTGTPVDMGVLVFHNITVVKDYFNRFEIPLNKADEFLTSEFYYDFRTGRPVSPTFTPSAEDVSAAFAAYMAQYSKYPGLINGTMLPSPVPEELYMPFGKFVEKYGTQAAIPSMYYFNPGVGDILSNPVIEQFRYWSSYMVGSVATDFLGPVRRNVSELYTRAEAELSSSSSLLLSSEVVHAHRAEGESAIKLVVRTPSGPKLIIVKKLVIAFPPKLDFLAPFDLSATEKTLFSKYIDTGYYVGLVKNSGLPKNASISNAAQYHTEFTFPYLPAAYSFAPSAIPGLQLVTYATGQTSKSLPLSDEAVKTNIINTIKRIQKQNPDRFTTTEPEFVVFASHAPYNLQVRSEDIRDGFYEKLYTLQGQRNTHWTGAAWKGEDSSLLWKYSEEIVVPQVMEGL